MNKLVGNYIISSLIFAITFVVVSLFLKGDVLSFRAPNGVIEYTRFFLFWVLIGLLISIILIIIGNSVQKHNKIIELVVSIFTTAVAFTFISYDIKAPVEGLVVVFLFGGIISGILIFFIKRIIFR